MHEKFYQLLCLPIDVTAYVAIQYWLDNLIYNLTASLLEPDLDLPQSHSRQARPI